ncbi:MAG: hypothetical protein WBQ50_21130 [Nocardioides sp.]
MVPEPLALALRTEVGRLRLRESRRVFDTAVHLGTLGGAHDVFVARSGDLPVLDTALRTDVLARLLEHVVAPGPDLWLTRSGHPEPYEEDVAWLASASAACAMHARALGGCFVVTRYGWRDVRTGESRRWKRLRL